MVFANHLKVSIVVLLASAHITEAMEQVVQTRAA